MKQKLITIILTLIAIAAPLLIVPGIDSYLPKLFVLLVCGLLLIVLLLIDYKNLKFDKRDFLILTFLLLAFISTFLSRNIAKSLIGEFGRYEGLLMFIIYICIYFCAKKYFDYKQMKGIFNILFYVCLGIGTLGILQRYIVSIRMGIGICGTFGNPNFFGSFISIVLPISMAVFIQKGNKKALILSLVMFFNMLSCSTRSAWVAFAVVALLGIAYLIKLKNKNYFKRFCTLSLGFILIFTFLMLSPKAQLSTRINLIKDEIESTFQSGLSNKMGSSRIEIWKMTLNLISQKPLFGCGPDNLVAGLCTNCFEELNTFATRTGGIPDKAHNEFLQIAATIGIPALIVYCIFIGQILFTQMKYMLKNTICFVFAITIISYLVQAFFNISIIGVAPLFWIILGLASNKKFIHDLYIDLYQT